MAHRSAEQLIGIYTDDPVACRALGSLLRFAGYPSECLCAGKELGLAAGEIDVLIVGPGMGTALREFPVGQAGIPVLHLVGHGEEPGAEEGLCLRWPVPTTALIRAIDAARYRSPRHQADTLRADPRSDGMEAWWC